MNTIQQSLHIGTPNCGIDLFCNVSIDGNHLFRMHSESFVGTYLQDLHSLIHGGHVRRLISPGDQYFTRPTLRGVQRNQDGDLEIYTGTSTIFSGTNYELGTNPDFSLHPMWIVVTDHSLIPELNGTWKIKAAHTDGRYVVIDGFPAEADISGFAWNAYEGYGHLKFFGAVGPATAYCQPFRDITPTVGSGNAPVSIHDISLERAIDTQLSVGTRSVSPLVTDQEKSLFTISQPFTNNTGQDVTILELGLATRLDTSRYGLKTGGNLYARDALASPTNLPNGKTLTLDYECRYELENFNQDTDLYGSNGGFLETFADYMRMQVLQTTRLTPESYLLCMGFGGGNCQSDTNTGVRTGTGKEGWRFGIRLGESNKFVSMTDQELSPDASTETTYNLGGLTHGQSEKQLIHHGMLIDDEITFNDATNEAHFSLSRVFENRTQTDITIKEIGLYGNGSTGTSANQIPRLVARRALHPNDQFTIAAGQMKKVSYKIKMVA